MESHDERGEERERRKKKSSIYTRTGDHGTSSLYNGERRSKTNIVFDALGDVDELNASIGVAREFCLQENLGIDDLLLEIQSRLLDVGSAIATPLHSSDEEKLKRTAFPLCHVDNLEEKIDEIDRSLPPLKNFILPGGGLASTHLHLARAICRRAERRACALREHDDVEQSIFAYLNRLSDFLFVAARFAAHFNGKVETIYQKHT